MKIFHYVEKHESDDPDDWGMGPAPRYEIYFYSEELAVLVERWKGPRHGYNRYNEYVDDYQYRCRYIEFSKRGFIYEKKNVKELELDENDPIVQQMVLFLKKREADEVNKKIVEKANKIRQAFVGLSDQEVIDFFACEEFRSKVFSKIKKG